MAQHTRAACLTAPQGPIVVSDVALADPGPGEARVRMEACGICHSDVMIAGLQSLPASPLVLGHEGIGVVEQVGEGVTNVSAGDRVGITYFAAGCGKCDACKSGNARFCARQQNHGYTRHGALAAQAVVAAQNLIRVPAALSAEQAAPLCCAGWTALGALHESACPAGGLVAIFGMGGLGHLALQYARHLGLRTAAVDVSEEKLEFARKLGAGAAVHPDASRQAIAKELGGADAAIVFTASAAAVPAAFSCLKRRGSLILVGLTGDRFSLPVSETVLKGIRIQGSYLGTRADLEQVFAFAEQGVARPEVSTYPLEEAPGLIERLKEGRITGRAVVKF